MALHESLEALAHAFIAFGQTLLSHAHGSATDSIEVPDAGQHSHPTAKKTRIKKEQAEKKPRAQTAYNLYVRENMERIRVGGNFENQREVMTAIGEAWRGLDPDEKTVYKQKADQAKAASATSQPVPQGLQSPSATTQDAAAILPSSQKKKKHTESESVEDGQGSESVKKKKKNQVAEEDLTVFETPQDGEKKKKKKKKKKALDDTECD